MGSREQILARVRASTADVPVGEPSAWSFELSDTDSAYARQTPLEGEALLELFAANCREYLAVVTRCQDTPEAIAAAVAAAAARHRASDLAAPVDLEPGWVPDGVVLHRDAPPLSVERLDGLDGTLTGAALGIARTGTIVLDAGAGQGRRVLSLVPDLHICVLRAAQLVGNLPEAMDVLAPVVGAGAPVTFISGPSATSDIELDRVEGVHGPRRLEILLAAPTPSDATMADDHDPKQRHTEGGPYAR